MEVKLDGIFSRQRLADGHGWSAGRFPAEEATGGGDRRGFRVLNGVTNHCSRLSQQRAARPGGCSVLPVASLCTIRG